MGTWNFGLLDNDDALDWLSDFTANKTEKFVIKTLKKGESNLDDFDQVLAASSIVLLKHGYPIEGMEPDLIRWAAKSRKPWSDSSRQKTVSLCEQIIADEETRSLWSNSEHYDTWIKNIRYVIHNLKKPPKKIAKEDIPKRPPSISLNDQRIELIEGMNVNTLIELSKGSTHLVMSMYWGDWESKHLNIIKCLLENLPNVTLEIDRNKKCATLSDKHLIEFIRECNVSKLVIECSGFDIEKALNSHPTLKYLKLIIGESKKKHCLSFLKSLPLETLVLRDSNLVSCLEFLTNMDSLRGLFLSVADYEKEKLPEFPDGLSELAFRCSSFTYQEYEKFDTSSIYRCSNLKALDIAVASENHKFEFEKLPLLERLMIDDQSSHKSWRVKSINNLKHLKNLKFLILHCVAPNNFDSLFELPKLQGLDCWNSNIEDFRDIPLKNLTRLVLKQGGQFSNISSLLSPKIRQLVLGTISKDDFNNLSGFEKLNTLHCYLYGNEFKMKDMEWLNRLEQATIYVMENNELSDDVFKYLDNEGVEQVYVEGMSNPAPYFYMNKISSYDHRGYR
jgi:hypothetical protein